MPAARQPRSNPLQSARFLLSAARPRQFPEPAPEVAFAGRSNAGKSSALNRLCDQRGLARTSKAPGRTRQINFFELAGGARLADLPGYGFAKVPESVRQDWARLVEAYLSKRAGLAGVVLIMDARHPLKDFDLQMLDYAAGLELPVHLLLSKADKLKRNARERNLAWVRSELGSETGVQLFSAESGLGIDEARTTVCDWLGIARRDPKD